MQELIEKWFVDHFHSSVLAHATEHLNHVRRAVDGGLKPLLDVAPKERHEALIERWFRDVFPGSVVDTNPAHFALVRSAVDDLKVRLASATP